LQIANCHNSGCTNLQFAMNNLQFAILLLFHHGMTVMSHDRLPAAGM
jgi:hypothetical protein